jgi:hypothetical protein
MLVLAILAAGFSDPDRIQRDITKHVRLVVQGKEDSIWILRKISKPYKDERILAMWKMHTPLETKVSLLLSLGKPCTDRGRKLLEDCSYEGKPRQLRSVAMTALGRYKEASALMPPVRIPPPN